LSVHPGLRGSNDLRFGRKMATFQLFFQSVGLRTYQHPCMRVRNVCEVRGYGLEVRETVIRFLTRTEIIFILKSVLTGSGAHSPSYSMGRGSLRAKNELTEALANRSLSPSAKGKNGCISPLPHIISHCVQGYIYFFCIVIRFQR